MAARGKVHIYALTPKDCEQETTGSVTTKLSIGASKIDIRQKHVSFLTCSHEDPCHQQAPEALRKS
jgi:hypothetical protein